jgi:hypothetical protein
VAKRSVQSHTGDEKTADGASGSHRFGGATQSNVWLDEASLAHEYRAKASLFPRRLPMKSAMWILVVGVVVFASAVSAQTDSSSSDPSSGLTASQETEPEGDHVRRAVFTTGVEEREPVDELMSVPAGMDTLWFFSEIVDLAGGSITHRWIYGGKTMAEVPFQIGGPRWRVYSSKILSPDRVGQWTVEIVDGDGEVLRRETIADAARKEEPAAE